MSPASSLHHKRSKRKQQRSVDILTTEVLQHNVDMLDDSRTGALYPSNANDIHDNPASVTNPGSYRIQRPHMNDPQKLGTSFKVVRQVDQHQYLVTDTVAPSIAPGVSTTTTTINTTTIPTASTCVTSSTPTASVTLSPNLKGQNPLSSIAVQSILGGLAAICIVAVLLRCLHVSRQHRAVIEARRQNLSRTHAEAGVQFSVQDGAGGIHLIPTNEMTLAARLNMYQARGGVRRHYYPYEQEPHSAAAGGRDGVRAIGSVNSSFIAPSYEQDVSPPPFLAVSGKPPAYVETMIIPPGPEPPTQPSETLPDVR